MICFLYGVLACFGFIIIAALLIEKYSQHWKKDCDLLMSRFSYKFHIWAFGRVVNDSFKAYGYWIINNGENFDPNERLPRNQILQKMKEIYEFEQLKKALR